MVGALRNLSPDERERVIAAIAAAQSGTEARFAFVVVPASDRYHLYPVVWGATAALVAFGLLALFEPHMQLRFAFTLVVALFVLSSLVLEWEPLRLRLAPRHVRHARAHTLAHREFAARILSHPEHKGGVLFFVSLAERYSEIIADHSLHQAAGQPAWDKLMAEFTDAAAKGRLAGGLVAAIEGSGVLLAAHHPKA